MSLLNDKQIVLVVGGSQGIGLALVKNLLAGKDSKFTSTDCRVIATIRSENAELEQLQQQFPGRLYTEMLDLTHPGAIETFAKLMTEKYGRLDLYIHNSGVVVEKPTSAANPMIDGDAYIKTHLLNTVAPQNLFCALLPLLQSTHKLLGGGSIEDQQQRPIVQDDGRDEKTLVRVLFISSTLGCIGQHLAGFGIPSYSASKAALNQLCRDLAHYYPYLAINVVNPGYVKTSLAPNGVITPDDSAAGILSNWNKFGFASIAMKAMFGWDANILNPLFEAEADVTKQVQLAEQQARQKIQLAEVDAEREYQKLKREEETKFQQEELQISGKGDASVQALVEKIEVQKKQQQQMYEKNQEAVVQLLLHQVTSSEIKLSEPQRQAFLAIKRAKETTGTAE